MTEAAIQAGCTVLHQVYGVECKALTSATEDVNGVIFVRFPSGAPEEAVAEGNPRWVLEGLLSVVRGAEETAVLEANAAATLEASIAAQAAEQAEGLA